MRALKIWFLFRSYGVTGLQESVRNRIRLAKYFESLVLKDNRFEVTNLVELGVVCFRQKANTESQLADSKRSPSAKGPSYCDEQNKNLLLWVNKSKNIRMCPCTLKGQYNLRISVKYEYATEKDILRAWKTVQRSLR